MHMITVRNIIFICYALYDTETLLQTLCKFIGGGFQRRTVQTEIHIFLFFPLCTGIIQTLHDTQCKWCSGLRLRMGNTCHITGTLAQSRISQRDGGITAK